MHTHTQVHTLWDTHFAVCLGTCSCWHCTEPRPPGKRLVHSPSPESERGGRGGRGRGRGRVGEREGEGGGGGLLYKAHKACMIQRLLYTQMNNMYYLELFLEASSLRVSCYLPHHFVNDDPDVSCHYLCLPTHHQFTQRVMDEHILCLHTQTPLNTAYIKIY